MWVNIQAGANSILFPLWLHPGFPLKQHLFLLGPLLMFVLLIGVIQGFWGEAPRLWFESLRSAYPTMKPLMRILSDYAALALYCGYFGLLIQALITHNKTRTYFVLRFVVFALVFGLLTHLLKAGVGMPRPGHTLPLHPLTFQYAYSSFPSGHTAAAISAAVPMALWIDRGKATILLSLLIAGVGISRLWLGAHHPVDILGSLILGSVAARFIYSGAKMDEHGNQQ